MKIIAYCVSVCQYLILQKIQTVCGISCFQCSTDQEPNGVDKCGVAGTFWTEEHALVDCSLDEAISPGTMCLKYTTLSPRAFIWDKRWKTIIRRCAQISSHGQLQGCDWGYDTRGTYWEQCYCITDGCNHSTRTYINFQLVMISVSSFLCLLLLRKI